MSGGQGGGAGAGIIDPPGGQGNNAVFRAERIIDDRGQDILLQFMGDPYEAYEFLQGYFGFKLARMEKRRKAEDAKEDAAEV